MPGGPQGGQGIGGGRPWQQFMGDAGDQMNYQRNTAQAGIDQANMDLRRAQIMGADPMVMARLEQEVMQQQRSMEQWQAQQYAEQMGQMSQRGPGSLGGGRQPSQMDQNPYLQMLLQSQLGMGSSGSNSGMRGGGMMGIY
jgi:hypothetical protein